MKSFKLISLQVVEDVGLVDIKLKDGLIINKEDDQRTWLIEAYVPHSYKEYFSSVHDENKNLIVQVIISRKENDPAFFRTKLVSVIELGEHISVLLEGSLNRSRNDYAERLLTKLINEGLSGEELIAKFKDSMISKPLLLSKD